MKERPLVSATDEAVQKKLKDLNIQLMKFYNEDNRMQIYFKHAHAINEVWRPGSYHWVLRSLVSRDMTVLDLGCGSGHAFENMESCGVKYTGIDWSEEQIQENSKKYQSKASFIASSLYNTPFRNNSFDLVFSLYVLEHLIWPHLFLREMIRLAKHGGLIIIICPHFRKAGRMPSFPHGGPGSFKEKIQKVQFISALKHLWYRWYWPKVIQKYPIEKFPWLINLEPLCLSEDWYTDNDAVYLVDRSECISELMRLGAEDLTDSILSHVMGKPVKDDEVCFIAAKKVQ